MQSLSEFHENTLFLKDNEWIHFYWLAIKLWKMLGYFTESIYMVFTYSTQVH